jgi:glutaminyl-peptide cyclotransferase
VRRNAWILLVLAMIVMLARVRACTSPPIEPPQTPTQAVEATFTSVPTLTLAPSPTPALPEFDGQRSYQDVLTQVEMGPRTPGSPAHAQAVQWMQDELRASGWEVEVQETTYQGHQVRNVIARRGVQHQPWVLLGAHYDSRLVADQDPNHPDLPVPGANDGASGVAVLTELARILPADLDKQIWLVFFDLEDQGNLPGYDWILGSRAFVDLLEGEPDAIVIVDMIGDADLNIHKERNSDPGLTEEIWAVAHQRGHDNVFLPDEKYSILDDHTPFLEQGMRAIDIIDFDYPYWHTIEDTADKVAPESLFAVGDTLLHWLIDAP